MSRAFAVLAVRLSFAFAVGSCGAEPPLDVAQGVDLGRFQGKWYEIAKLPRATQTNCYGTTAFYTPQSDGSFQFVNQCNVDFPTGPIKTVAMTATVPDTSVPAKLALDVGGFSGDYWILEVGASYEYAVVGHPSRDYFWILSRTPTLDSVTTQGILARAQKNQFDTTQIEYTPQPPAGEQLSSDVPVGPVPAPMSGSGCSAAPGQGGGFWAAPWCLGLAAIAIARRRRLPSC